MDAQKNLNTSDTSSSPQQKTDISKTTLVVLVLLTLVISVIGTWSVLQEVNSVRMVQESKPATGKVSFSLTPENGVVNGPSQPISGNVALEIQ